MSRWLLRISKDGDSMISLGSLCHCSVTLTVKKLCLMFRQSLPYCSLCPLPLVLSLGTTGKSLAPSSLHPPFSYLWTFVRSPWSFLFSRPRSPSSLSLFSQGEVFQSLHHVCDLCWSVQYLHVSLVLGSPELDTALQVKPHQCWVEEKDPVPPPAGNNPNAAQVTITLSNKGSLLAQVQSGVHQHPQVLSCQAAFQRRGPQRVLVPGVVPPQVRDFALLVELHEVPVSQPRLKKILLLQEQNKKGCSSTSFFFHWRINNPFANILWAYRVMFVDLSWFLWTLFTHDRIKCSRNDCLNILGTVLRFRLKFTAFPYNHQWVLEIYLNRDI